MLALLGVALASASAAGPHSLPWVGLGAGKHGAYEWSAKAVRPTAPAGAKRAGARRPCLVVDTIWRTGRFELHRSESRQCVEPGEPLSATSAPLITSGAQPSTGADVQMTAIGMLFAAPTSVVTVLFCDGTHQTIHLRSIGGAEASVAGLESFRYAAFAVEGLWCAERISSRDAAGRTLWDSGDPEAA